MQNIRCRCGKIVCQVDNMPHMPKVEDVVEVPKSPGIVILCRHCKRFVVIQVPTVSGVSFASTAGTQREPALST